MPGSSVGDELTVRETPGPPAPARLLPSGDAYTLGITIDDRALLVPDANRQSELWTPRVWPGAILVEGSIVGTWRRAQGKVTIQTWERLSGTAREAVITEAESLPLPDLAGRITVERGRLDADGREGSPRSRGGSVDGYGRFADVDTAGLHVHE